VTPQYNVHSKRGHSMKLRVNFGRPQEAEPLNALILWRLIADVVNRHSDRLRDSGLAPVNIFVAEVQSTVLARGFLRDLAPVLRAYIDAGRGRFVMVELDSHVVRADRSEDVAGMIYEVSRSDQP
jgi:hypothetical protein